MRHHIGYARGCRPAKPGHLCRWGLTAMAALVHGATEGDGRKDDGSNRHTDEHHPVHALRSMTFAVSWLATTSACRSRKCDRLALQLRRAPYNASSTDGPYSGRLSNPVHHVGCFHGSG